MYASNYYEDKILRLAKAEPITPPSTVYLALWIGNPTEAGTGGQEASYAGYARQPIVFGAPTANGSSMQITNSAAISFPEASADGGTVTHVAVMDGLTSGNMWLYGDLGASPLAIQSGVAPLVQASAITFILTGALSVYYKTAILNIMRGTTYTISGFNGFMAMFNGDPQGTGNEFVGNGYTRMPMAFDAPVESATGPMEMVNSAAVYSPESTAAWGTWTHTAIMDAESGGNIFVSFAKTASKAFYKGYSGGYKQGKFKITVN